MSGCICVQIWCWVVACGIGGLVAALPTIAWRWRMRRRLERLGEAEALILAAIVVRQDEPRLASWVPMAKAFMGMAEP